MSLLNAFDKFWILMSLIRNYERIHRICKHKRDLQLSNFVTSGTDYFWVNIGSMKVEALPHVYACSIMKLNSTPLELTINFIALTSPPSARELQVLSHSLTFLLWVNIGSMKVEALSHVYIHACSIMKLNSRPLELAVEVLALTSPPSARELQVLTHSLTFLLPAGVFVYSAQAFDQ